MCNNLYFTYYAGVINGNSTVEIANLRLVSRNIGFKFMLSKYSILCISAGKKLITPLT